MAPYPVTDHPGALVGAHGLRRTNADKRRAVMTLLRDEEWGGWSDREIARRCGVGHQMVSPLRASLSGRHDQIAATRTAERNGTVYQVNTANIGRRGEVEASDAAPKTTP